EFQGDDAALVAVFAHGAVFVGREPAATTPAGEEGDVLLTVDGIGNRCGDDGGTDLQVQQLFAACGIVGAQIAAVSALEHQAACCGQNAGTVPPADGFLLPYRGAGQGIEGLQHGA